MLSKGSKPQKLQVQTQAFEKDVIASKPRLFVEWNCFRVSVVPPKPNHMATGGSHDSKPAAPLGASPVGVLLIHGAACSSSHHEHCFGTVVSNNLVDTLTAEIFLPRGFARNMH
eukprot:6461294-Amphidinium_carterae.1